MFNYNFKIYPLNGLDAVCEIAVDDEFYFVNINGKSLGTMLRDDESEFGYTTQDEELKPLLGVVVKGLREYSDDDIEDV